jgi:hypothetical protein
MSNYFEAGLELLDALELKREEWGINHIGMISGVDQINQEITPAIYLANTGNTPVDEKAGSHQLSQQWTVVIAISHHGSETEVRNLMVKGGELIKDVVKYIQNLQPSNKRMDPFKVVRTAGKARYFSTFGLYPFTFQTKFTI